MATYLGQRTREAVSKTTYNITGPMAAKRDAEYVSTRVGHIRCSKSFLDWRLCLKRDWTHQEQSAG